LRRVLLRTAGGLEWLYRAAHRNPYESQLARRPEPVTTPEPAPVPIADSVSEPSLSLSDFVGGGSGPAASPIPLPASSPLPSAPEQLRQLADGTPVWPLPPQLHPAVAALPAEAETSIAAVARYLAGQESNPWMRIKALHDYVADRVSYDVESYRAGKYPPQDAETVFRTRRSVCAGYANLLAALGQASGDEIVVVGGDARTDGRDITGEGHAWNAARIGGRWTLLDATWDAGHVGDGPFVKKYSTEFLFTPPEVNGLSHFPEEEQWQLRHPALSRGEFFRQPLMRPRFFAEGYTLVSPSRPQVTVATLLHLPTPNPHPPSLPP